MGTLRFLLAFSVVTAHIPRPTFHFFDSHIAVESFFVISGFICFFILNEKYSSYFSFLSNRFFRLYPVYWAVLCITFIFVLFHNNFIYSTFWQLLSIPTLILIDNGQPSHHRPRRFHVYGSKSHQWFGVFNRKQHRKR